MSFRTKLTGLALLTSVAVAYSTGAQAGIQTWDFNSPPTFDFAGNGNSWMMTSSDGINLTVTGWSDTGELSGDDLIEDAELHWAYTSPDALGVINRDERAFVGAGNNVGSPNHSTDSYKTGSDLDGGYDMLLLTFDTAVDLTGIDLAWGRDGTTGGQADLSLLALDDGGDAALGGKTWSQVLGGDYSSVGNYNNVPASSGLSYYTVNSANVTSNTWLIGAYNPVFGDSFSDVGDGFKLDYITTVTDDTPPTGDVPVPGSFGLVLLGLVGLRKRLMRG